MKKTKEGVTPLRNRIIDWFVDKMQIILSRIEELKTLDKNQKR